MQGDGIEWKPTSPFGVMKAKMVGSNQHQWVV
jgi:hypothetical protein